MSTWISRLVLGLALCQPLTLWAETALPKAVTLRAEEITVQGPAGYCPDPATLRQTGGAVAVLLGRCTDQAESPPAVISVTFGRAGSAAVMASGGAEMAAFFASEAGRKSLSRRGRAADVAVTSARSLGDLFLFRVADRGIGTYWRGMTALNGRTVSIKVSGPDLDEVESRKLVESTSRALRRANR
ncbi:cation transport ATPase [Pseudotabrizicola sediminis]|uniref:cation transport ATPase n=1 Tax=Pseudotabrizicola sediminis TaxID=2486418 RepID=UPI001081A9F0|nr:cation transport ATPase [Pseudotabrizicola sediminis]